MEEQTQYNKQPNKNTKVWTFYSNWNNKLHCKYFTTFRWYERGKIKIGQPIITKLMKGQECVKQEINQIYCILPYVLNEVPAILAYLDTGYSQDEFRAIVQKMYKNKNVDFDRECFAIYLLGPYIQ